MKQRWARILLYAVLVGWCLLFLRCETTEKKYDTGGLSGTEGTDLVGGAFVSVTGSGSRRSRCLSRTAHRRWPRADIGNSSCRRRSSPAADGRLPPVRLFAFPGADGRRRALCIRSILCWNAAAGAQRPDFPAQNLIWKHSCSRAEKRRLCPTNCWTNSKRARRQCPGCMHTRKACCRALLARSTGRKVMVSGSGAFRTGSGAVQRLQKTRQRVRFC